MHYGKMAEKFSCTFSLYKQCKIRRSQMLQDTFKLLLGCFLDALNIFEPKKDQIEKDDVPTIAWLILFTENINCIKV